MHGEGDVTVRAVLEVEVLVDDLGYGVEEALSHPELLLGTVDGDAGDLEQRQRRQQSVLHMSLIEHALAGALKHHHDSWTELVVVTTQQARQEGVSPDTTEIRAAYVASLVNGNSPSLRDLPVPVGKLLGGGRGGTNDVGPRQKLGEHMAQGLVRQKRALSLLIERLPRDLLLSTVSEGAETLVDVNPAAEHVEGG